MRSAAAFLENHKVITKESMSMGIADNGSFRHAGVRATALASSLMAVVAMVAALAAIVATPSHAAPALEVTVSDEANMMQGVRVEAGAGQFRLSFKGETTGDIAFNASAAIVQAALNGLSTINTGGGSVTVTGQPGGLGTLPPYMVTFDGGPLAGKPQPMLDALRGTTPLSGGPASVVFNVSRPAGLSRSDERMDYLIRVKNTSSSAPAIGASLTCSGTEPGKNWTPNGFEPTQYEYEWRRNGVLIAGETSDVYTVAAADVGAALQCVVKGTNATAASKWPSLPATIVGPVSSPSPPVQVSPTGAASRPTITPTTGAVGVQRTCGNPANWTAGTPAGAPVTFTYQWLRNGDEINGATASTYTPVAGDDGKVLQCMVTGTTGTGAAPDGGALVAASPLSSVGSVSNPPTMTLLLTGTPSVIVNGAVIDAVTVELPAGQNTRLVGAQGSGWSCTGVPAVGSSPAKALCATAPTLIAPGAETSILLAVGLDPNGSEDATVEAVVSGPGVVPAAGAHSRSFDPFLPFDFMPGTFTAEALDPDWDDYTQAAGHPHTAASGFAVNRRRIGGIVGGDIAAQNNKFVPIEHAKDAVADIPAGFIGNPRAVPKVCNETADVLAVPPACPPESAVGGFYLMFPGTGNANGGYFAGPFPIFLLKPERGAPAQLAFGMAQNQGIYVFEPRLRPQGGYAISVHVEGITQNFPVLAGRAVLCSYGGRVGGGIGLFEGCKGQGDVGAFEKPFLTSQTECSGQPPVTRLHMNSWQNPGVWASAEAFAPLMDGCELVPFTPAFSVSPTSRAAGSPSGLEAEIAVSSDGLEDPDGLSQAHLKKTVVELPAGVSVNPSAATGLEGCSDAQLGLKTNSEPGCPDGSKIADVQVTSPLLVKRNEDGTVLEDGEGEPVLEPVDGTMVLRTPESTDPMSGGMLRMALIVRNDERGILVKLPGSATADPQTGRLTATFDDNPQLPIANVRVQLKGGARGVLAMPQDCGPASTKTTLTPWSGNADAVADTPRSVDQGCGERFAPELSAGSSDNRARGQGGTYSFKFSREDGEQWLRGLTAKLPKGLLASVRDVPLCSNAAADAGSCPAGSRIGVVDAKAGAGDPFVLEEKGEVFLTEGYKGGEYGLAVKVRPVAGPFRGEHELSPIVVRQAIHVDRTATEVTAVSDPFPLIHHGVPLRVREVNVLVNRGGFMVNPSDCSQKHSSASLLSDEGATAKLSDAFQVSDCANLAFKPKLTLGLSGKRQVTTGKHPAIKAKVTQQGTSEAGIEKAVVRLPKSLALDVNNAGALCEFVDGTKPDLENHCPKASIVGRARAKTPLLKNDLVGNVYFVKNVRKDPVTGNEIRTLPMIVVALRGEISVNLKGESDTTRAGKLVNTFNRVPDAPISQFNLNIKGGKNGILAVTRTRRANINLCAKPKGHVAEADMDGHNGRRHDRDIRMKTPCTKRQVRKAKRAAAKDG